MNAYTSLEQSRKLAKFLPLESADMFWLVSGNTPRVHVLTEPLSNYSHWENYPCWSLAALLNIINDDYYTTLYHDGVAWNITAIHHDNVKDKHNVYANTPIDACVAMILTLKEKDLL